MRRFLMPVLMLVLTCTPALAVEKSCDYCHKDHGVTGKLLNSDLNELCLSCHADRTAKGEHKVGVKPEGSAKGLPLQNGLMTCISCHNPHSKQRSMLWKTVNDLCEACHEK